MLELNSKRVTTHLNFSNYIKKIKYKNQRLNPNSLRILFSQVIQNIIKRFFFIFYIVTHKRSNAKYRLRASCTLTWQEHF
ncbi:hypothetical protein MARHY3223 [Marinobacter nauticus ATCC 49840]|nr:hypothetical protein MARHY3223 [Marinobacter nauticus ATCC 49840]